MAVMTVTAVMRAEGDADSSLHHCHHSLTAITDSATYLTITTQTRALTWCGRVAD